MPNKKTLANFTSLKQATDMSCWACTSRMIVNYYEDSEQYSSDQKIADAYATLTNNVNDKDLSKSKSASDVLTLLGYKNEMDDHHFPTYNEIKATIDADTPLLSLVATQSPTGLDAQHESNHWVVIVGYDNGQIVVADPYQNNLITIAYDKDKYVYSGYADTYYWVNTSYVDKK